MTVFDLQQEGLVPAALRVRRLDASDPAALEVERALDAAGTPLPLPARVAWSRAHSRSKHLVVVAERDDGHPVAMLAIALTPTRSLPFHVACRIEALGDSYATSMGATLLRAARDFVVSRGRVVSLTVELECRSDDARGALRDQLIALGFERIRAERSSERTIALDLAPGEDEILAGFSRSHRQNVRNIAKHDLALEPLRDPAFGPRMNALLAASMARTGARGTDQDWAPLMTMGEALPHRSRLVGVFHGSGRAPDDLLAFAWGLHHGDRGEYSTGASTRVPGVRLPLLHAAIWDLIVWSKREGAAWFDFGGVTAGSTGSDDALGGISDFKRGFSRTEIDFGQEWVFTPSVWKARLAGAASRLVRRLRSLKR